MLPVVVSLAVVALTTLYFYLQNQKSAAERPPPGYQRVPHLFSWTPFLGSANKLTKRPIREFIRLSANKLKAPAFTATILGDKCLFVAESDLLSLLFQESKHLEGRIHQRRFMRNVAGFTKAQTEILFNNEMGTPKKVMQLYHKYLLDKDGLNRVIQSSQKILIKEIDDVASVEDASLWSTESLFSFVSRTIFRASAGPLLSMNLIPNAEACLKELQNFEHGLALLLAGVPNFVVPECVKARGALFSLFMSDLLVSSESPFLQERRRLMTEDYQKMPELKKDVDFTIGRSNMGVLLALVGNSTQAMFWTVLNLLDDPKAYQECTKAVQEVIAKRPSGSSPCFSLEELDQLVILQSAIFETLRLYEGLFVRRTAVEDFCLNPKEKVGPKYIVEKGTTIMLFPNSMHMDPTIYANPEEFRYDRFLYPDAKSLKGTPLSSHFRPFGAGQHMCPGHKFIGYEARAMLAFLFSKYEMRIKPGESRPGIDLSRQGRSVGAPENDIEFQVRQRST